MYVLSIIITNKLLIILMACYSYITVPEAEYRELVEARERVKELDALFLRSSKEVLRLSEENAKLRQEISERNRAQQQKHKFLPQEQKTLEKLYEYYTLNIVILRHLTTNLFFLIHVT